MNMILRSSLFLLAILVLVSCKEETPAVKPVAPAAPKQESTPLTNRYTEITAQSGISFVHNNGAFGKKYLPNQSAPDAHSSITTRMVSRTYY